MFQGKIRFLLLLVFFCKGTYASNRALVINGQPNEGNSAFTMTVNDFKRDLPKISDSWFLVKGGSLELALRKFFEGEKKDSYMIFVTGEAGKDSIKLPTGEIIPWSQFGELIRKEANGKTYSVVVDSYFANQVVNSIGQQNNCFFVANSDQDTFRIPERLGSITTFMLNGLVVGNQNLDESFFKATNIDVNMSGVSSPYSTLDKWLEKKSGRCGTEPVSPSGSLCQLKQKTSAGQQSLMDGVRAVSKVASLEDRAGILAKAQADLSDLENPRGVLNWRSWLKKFGYESKDITQKRRRLAQTICALKTISNEEFTEYLRIRSCQTSFKK